MAQNYKLGNFCALVSIIIVLGQTGTPNLAHAASENSYKYKLQWMNPDPYFIDVDSSGNVYVAGRNTNRIDKYDSNGTFLKTWGRPGSGEGQFNDPEGIAVDNKQGVIYVTDSNNDRIQKFDLSGKFLSIIGSFGSGAGQFKNPAGIAVDLYGNIYVADRENDRIQKLYPNGTFILVWGREGTGLNEFNSPESVAVDRFGHVYVGDEENNRVLKFDSDGNYISILANKGYAEGSVIDPEDVAVDTFNNVYIADSDNSRIQRFNVNGTLTDVWGGEGSGDGNFNDPRGVAVDNHGNVYVADTGNVRIQKFEPSTGFLVAVCTYSGSRVRTTSQPEDQTPLLGTTDQNGIAEFRGVRPGTYELEESRDGRVIGTQTAEVLTGQETRTIIISETIDLRVTVKDSHGTLIAGAKVLMVNMPDGQFASTGFTDVSGTTVDFDLLPGDYVYEVSKAGFTTVTTNTVTVTTSGTHEIAVTLDTGAPTTGNLKISILDANDLPIQGVHVESLIAPNEQNRLSVTSEFSHNFFFSNIKLGTYELKASKSSYITENTGQVNVIAGVTTEIAIVLQAQAQPTGDLEVTVKNPLGDPVSGATVSMIFVPSAMQPALSDVTNLEGIVIFPYVLPGDYMLKVHMNGFVNATSNTVTVTAGTTSKVTITLQLDRPALVLDRFVFHSIVSPQYKDSSIYITVTAKDQYGDTFTSFTGSVTITVLPESTGISPFTVGPFVEGVWDGPVTINKAEDSISFKATSSDGKSGISNSFEVRTQGTSGPWDPWGMVIGTWNSFWYGIEHWGDKPCIIATATYGSPFAPEVVYMRHVRDDLIGSNDVGKILVTGWNKFYYSWSPPIAYSISGSPPLRSTFTVLLLPLLGSMHVVAFMFESLAIFSPELASILSFLMAAVLATSIYIVMPLWVMRKILMKNRKHSKETTHM